MFIFIVTCQLPGRIGDCVWARTVNERATVSRAIELKRNFMRSPLADLNVGTWYVRVRPASYELPDNQGHSQAAPRTPLESPWRAGTIGVSAESEKTKDSTSGGTRS